MTTYLASTTPVYEARLPGGHHWSLLVRRGHVLRLIDTEGGANVGMLLYNPLDKLERYNAPDTLKCQHTFKLTRGHCLYSDMGRVFCSIVGDSVGWHDTVGGYLDDATLHERWGEGSYQQLRNDWLVSGEHAFLVELANHGLGRRDLAANLNWFSKVAVDDTGQMSLVADHSKAGAFVDLRFELDSLVILHTCPHPMAESADYPRRPVDYRVYKALPVADDDECLNSRPENRRGFANNAIYYHEGVGSHDC